MEKEENFKFQSNEIDYSIENVINLNGTFSLFLFFTILSHFIRQLLFLNFSFHLLASFFLLNSKMKSKKKKKDERR